MIEYVFFGIAILLPSVFTSIFLLLEKRTKFGEINYWVKQIIIGIVFGLLAIFGTEKGIPIHGAQVNMRDAAVLTAGLFFGGPAGIIAGLIGGIERAFAVLWGVGKFTVVACSISTIVAGLFAALVRKFILEGKNPGLLLSLCIGSVMETFHMMMVFNTNADAPEKAMAVIKSCSAIMIIGNAVSVFLVALFINIQRHNIKLPKIREMKISEVVQACLLIVVIITFIFTTILISFFETSVADNECENDLQNAIVDMNESIPETIDSSFAAYEKIGKDGFCVVYTNRMTRMYSKDLPIPSLSYIMECAKNSFKSYKTVYRTFEAVIDNTDYKCMFYRNNNGQYVFAALPVEEVYETRDLTVYINVFMEVLVFALLFAAIFILIKRVVVDKIDSVNQSLGEISKGNLDTIVDIHSNQEFSSLSHDINETVSTLKRYIAEADARIDKELQFARDIQKAALPNVETLFPDKNAFDVHAFMTPAKQVGGDFYDVYITEHNKLNFLIADVSGKGIPAAMFMMRAKTELRSLTEALLPLESVFTNGNNALCDGNDAGMFVTAWQGKLHLDSGKLEFANAGHNPPVICKANGQFEFLRSKSGLVLAGMEGIHYKKQEYQLERGDIIFLYTDGVTEATNSNNELFGESRLLEALNTYKLQSMKDLCNHVKECVDAFAGEAPQFDDITMVALKY